LINITIFAEEDIKLMAEFEIAQCKTAGLPAIPAIRKVLGCSKKLLEKTSAFTGSSPGQTAIYDGEDLPTWPRLTRSKKLNLKE